MSAAVPAANSAASGSPAPAPASRGPASGTVTRSAYAPGTISPASGEPTQACPLAGADTARPAQAGVPSVRRRLRQVGRGEVAAPLGRQPLRQLHPPRLFQQVDHAVPVA